MKELNEKTKKYSNGSFFFVIVKKIYFVRTSKQKSIRTWTSAT